ncbi:MAG TPA: hypothetical protein VE377_20350 [Candidatus Dormibacteraeota bacterium]|nr:hypothetical protein [Candidatus Dormibacteraeota bacterium]
MEWKDKVDLGIKALAAAAGGFWVVLNYFRGRTHKPRLQLRVAADRVPLDGVEYLIVKAELENVGLARVQLKHGGSHVTIFADETPRVVPFAWGSSWKQIEKRFPLLEDQQWVEPSSLVNDQILIAVPRFADRFIRVLAHAESEEVAWNAWYVVGRLDSTLHR